MRYMVYGIYDIYDICTEDVYSKHKSIEMRLAKSLITRPTYAHVCRRMLTYAYLRMLSYANVLHAQDLYSYADVCMHRPYSYADVC